jgi:hypothetical protein
MSQALTLEEQATNFQTMQHIARVQHFLHAIAIELLRRAELHDQSKLASPEVESFTEHTAALKALDYGSPEYNEQLKKLGPALVHHYAKNRHHTEHWPNGINDMNIVDVVEMLCDWKAATERHDSGNLRQSIEHNAGRYHIDHQLTQIFKNSIDLFEKT